MRLIWLIILFVLCTNNAFYAQSSENHELPENVYTLNVNLLGDGSLFSAHLELQRRINSNGFISATAGLGYNEEFELCIFSNSCQTDTYLSIPHHLSYNLGKNKSFLEIGLGGTYYIGEPKQQYLFYPILGYRFHDLDGRINSFRFFLHIRPFPTHEEQESRIIFVEKIIFPVFGLSVGIKL